MEVIFSILRAFILGGIFCLIGQFFINKTGLTPARILTMYVVAGVILGAVGIYQPLLDWGGAGASVPLTGFGAALAKGVREGVEEQGLLGALTGGITACAGGITAAICFSALAAFLGKSKDKSK
ncbi:MAG: SpoVA/SpoVAEb family sporulation membrane protein [Oscillospiraceae bacterium]|nr:SpoVA/SpoVAEb family sporulation membrane protein [Oscillospiraceae bacterium]